MFQRTIAVIMPLPFPGKLAEQAQLVRQVLQTSARPLAAAGIVERFRNARSDQVEETAEMLTSAASDSGSTRACSRLSYRPSGRFSSLCSCKVASPQLAIRL